MVHDIVYGQPNEVVHQCGKGTTNQCSRACRVIGGCGMLYSFG